MDMGRDMTIPLLTDILICLPVIALLRFKRVCKGWCSLIESFTFVNEHLNSKREEMLICASVEADMCIISGRKYEMRRDLNIENKFRFFEFEMYNTCNGVVLYKRLSFDDDGVILSMWNPATNKVRQMAVENTHINGFREGFVSFALGFNKRENEFRVVSIILEVKQCMLQVWSAKKESWKTVYEGDFAIDGFYATACSEEKVLWYGGVTEGKGGLVYFDWGTEKCGVVPFPENIDNWVIVPAYLKWKASFLRWRQETGFKSEIWWTDEIDSAESWGRDDWFESKSDVCCRAVEVKLLHNGNAMFILGRDGDEDGDGGCIGLYWIDLCTVACEPVRVPMLFEPSFILDYRESLMSV